ncbi:hypothetical protein [Commensalibacter intestini]|uniref:hypothetical protein n=1 Tax=Commensalibacter intestini TaxID=479936 RepID=UPI001185AC91|nr:hypothetical protein [Commensalibacter intestini]
MTNIITFFVSFAQKYVTKLFVPLAMFLIGHRLASKNAKIKEQQHDLQNSNAAVALLKKMQETEAKAPSDKSSLLQSLSKGDF